MSEYTPNTFFIEALYVAKAIDKDTDTREARFQFYRWLDWMATQHFAIEQDRILQIIKKHQGKPDFTIQNLAYMIEEGKDVDTE